MQDNAGWKNSWALFLPLAAIVGHLYPAAALQFLPLATIQLAVFGLGRFQRLQGFFLYGTFYLSATAPLILAGSTVLHANLPIAVGLWFFHGALCSAPVLLLRGKKRILRGTFVACLYILPPFGYLAPNNPALATGLLFPGMGILGVLGFILTAGLIAGGVPVTWKSKSSIAAAVLVVAWANILTVFSLPPALPSGWMAVDTNFGQNSASMESRLHVGNIDLPKLVKSLPARLANEKALIFMPEGLLYDRGDFTEYMWKEALRNSSAIAVVGFNDIDAGGKLYSSKVTVFGEGPEADQVRSALDGKSAAVTFPFTMWHPWQEFEHYPMGLPNRTTVLNGHKIHVSWCYETTLLWPHLMASIEKPEFFVSLENRWSTKGTTLESAQQLAGRLNARWLGSTLIAAVNR